MNLNLLHLESFMVVAQTEHMTQAAEQLHVTQPALSRTIAGLEAELGQKLFDREGKRLRLNPYGEIVYRYASQVFHNLSEMQLELSSFSSGESGKLRLGSSFPSREPNWLLDIIRSFMLDHPSMTLSLTQLNFKDMVEKLESRDIDLAICSADSAIPNHIEWTELFSERMGIILSVNHPLAQKPEISMSDLANEYFLSNNSNSDIPDLTYAYCHQAGFHPKTYFEGDFPGFIGEMISKGVGVSFISERGFSRDAHKEVPRGPWEDLIIFRYLKEDYCKRTYGIANLKDRFLSPLTLSFRSFIIEHAFEILSKE